MAILLALRHIITLNPIPHTLHLCSDSRAGLLTIARGPARQSSQVGFDIWSSLNALLGRGSQIYMVWVPGHVGIEGNEAADILAGQASNLDQCGIPVSKITANAATHQRILSCFNTIYPSSLPPLPSDFSLLNRFEQCTFSQLRSGCSSVTFDTLFLFGKTNSPNCPSCGLPDSIAHLITDCPSTYRSRSRAFASTNLFEILSDSAGKVLAFLRELGRVPQ